MQTLFWDFFGPTAEPSARHFHKHLDEFLVRNDAKGCSTGLASEGAGHHAAYCTAPPEVAEIIAKSLRPKRIVPA